MKKKKKEMFINHWHKSVCSFSQHNQHSISYHILYIIAEAERKLVSTFKEVLTNRKKDSLKYIPSII